MISKKIYKIPKPIITRTKLHHSSDEEKPLIEKKKVLRYRYRMIPQHAKFEPLYPVYKLNGDLPLMLHEGGLSLDISFFNESKIFQNVSVTEMFDQKLVIVRPTPRSDKDLSSITDLLDQLGKSQNPRMNEWHNTIKLFYQTYDKVMKNRDNPAKRQKARQERNSIARSTPKRKNELNFYMPIFQFFN